MEGIKYIAATVAILAAAAFSQEPALALGTATNPIIKADAPDVSFVRVGNAYYMVSTTMYFMPPAPIMKSYDLVNWRIVSYCANIIEDRPTFNLQTDNGTFGEYARGQWAASLRYYNNRFWVMFANNTTHKTYLFHTENADTGPWTRIEFNRQFHDPSLFYDEANNKLYVISGAGTINLTELQLDGSAVKQGGTSKNILRESDFSLGGTVSGTEGSHVYFRNGYYYVIMITWLNSMRTVICARTQDLVNGTYEVRQLLRSGLGSRGGGVAQGGIIETPDGDWYGLFFQDRDAIGRVPVLVPMTWSNNWPVFTTPIPETLTLKLAQNYGQYVYASDEFSGSALSLVWQWNHNPVNANWSLTEKPGYMRLKTVGTAKTIFHARNTLTQRTVEPESEATVLLEPVNMKDGDKAGLMVLQSRSGLVGIEQESGQKYIVMYTGDNETQANRGDNAIETRQARVPFTGDKVYLKAECKFKIPGRNSETAAFSYSLDGVTWTSIGTTVNLLFNYQTHFTGARFGIFNYAKQTSGGHVDFDYFRFGGNIATAVTATCNLDNFQSPYTGCNNIPRPNIVCSNGAAGAASFSVDGSAVTEWNNAGGTKRFCNSGIRNVTMSSLVCGSAPVTLSSPVNCGSFIVRGEPVECNYQTSYCGGKAFADVQEASNAVPATGTCVYIENFEKIQPNLESTVAINGVENTCGTEWGEEEGKCMYNTKPLAIDGGYYVHVKNGGINLYDGDNPPIPNGWTGVVAAVKPNCASFTTGIKDKIPSDKTLHLKFGSAKVVEIYNLKGKKVASYNVLGAEDKINVSLPSGVYIAKARGMQSVKFVVR